MFTFIVGGARSGKSKYAEAVALSAESRGLAVHYIATAQAFDNEMSVRIAKHQKSRPKHWVTHEIPLNVSDTLSSIPDKSVVIIDCITIWISNHMMAADTRGTSSETAHDESVRRLMQKISEFSGDVIAVSNEVGLGIVPDNELARLFRDVAGRVNQQLAAAAGCVYFMVSGLPITLKQ